MDTFSTNHRKLSVDSNLSSDSLPAAGITGTTNAVLDSSLPCGPSSEDIQSQLWPRPQRLTLHNGQVLALSEELPIKFFQPSGYNSNVDVPSVMETWARFKETFCDLGHKLVFLYRTSSEATTGVVCTINRDLFLKEESYVLTLTETAVYVKASDIHGMNFAIVTLIQLIAIFKNKSEMPQLQVNDWPSFKHRAFLVDISVGSAKVPTMEALRNVVEMWSKLKFNQLHIQINLEATAEWQVPYTPMEMLQLESFCNDRSVSLVPSLDVIPSLDFVLRDVDIDAVDLIAAIKIYLQAFTKIRYVALGDSLVSTLTSGGRKLEEVLPFDLCKVTLMLPSSFVATADAIFKLQAVSIINSALFKISPLSLKSSCQCLSLNPVEHSGLCSFSPETISSICEVIEKSYEECHLGVVVSPRTSCLWTTPVSYLAPTTLALGLAWNHNCQMPVTDHLSNHLNSHMLHDNSRSLGQVLLELGGLENQVPVLWSLLEDPDSTDIEKYTAHIFQRVIRQLLGYQSQLHKAELQCPRSGEIVAEVQLLIDLLIFAARIGRSLVSVGTNPNSNYGISVINVGITNLPSTARTDLANKLLGLIDQFNKIWLSGHLQHNLESILLKLTRLLNLLVPPENVNDY